MKPQKKQKRKEKLSIGKEKHVGFMRFQKECKRQIERLGLKDWDIQIVHGRLPEGHENAAAITEMSCEGKVAMVALNKRYQHKDPERIAKHEMAHLLIGRIEGIAERRFASENDLHEAVESLCTVLEKVL